MSYYEQRKSQLVGQQQPTAQPQTTTGGSYFSKRKSELMGSQQQMPQKATSQSPLLQRLQKRVSEQEAREKAGQTFLETQIQRGGQAVGAITDIAMTGAGKLLSAITPNFIEAPIKKSAEKIGQYILPAITPVAEKYEEFRQENPRLAGNIEGVANIASVLPIGKGAQLAAQGAKTATKGAVKGAIKRATPSMVDSLERTYQDLASGVRLSKKLKKSEMATEAKNLAGTTGFSPTRILAEEGVIPKQKGSRLDTIEQAEEYRKSLKPLQQANRENLNELKTFTPKISLLDEEEKAVKRVLTPENINAGKAESLENEIRKEFAGLRRFYGNTVDITEYDDIKSARWGRAPFDSTRPLLSDANYNIAKTAQQTIEDVARTAGYDDLAQLNRSIGDRLEAAKFLESLHQKVIKGGQLQKMLFGLIGSGVGNSIPAKILGYLGGEAIANVMMSNAIADPVKRLILKNVNRGNVRGYEEAVKWLEKQGVLKSERKLLPPPSAIYAQPPTYSGEVRGFKPTTIQQSRQAVGLPAEPDLLRLPAPGQTTTGKIELPNRTPRSQADVDAEFGRNYSSSARMIDQPIKQATAVVNRNTISSKILPIQSLVKQVAEDLIDSESLRSTLYQKYPKAQGMVDDVIVKIEALKEGSLTTPELKNAIKKQIDTLKGKLPKKPSLVSKSSSNDLTASIQKAKASGQSLKYKTTINIQDKNDLDYLRRIFSDDTIADIKAGKKTNWRGESYSDIARVNIISETPKTIAQQLEGKVKDVKLKSDTFYHGTSAGNADSIMSSNFKLGSQLPENAFRGGGYGKIQNSISLAETPKEASIFSELTKGGKIIEVKLKPNSKVVSIEGVEDATDLEDYISYLKKEKIDAVYIGGGEKELVIINPKSVTPTRSQLKAEWDKVSEKKPVIEKYDGSTNINNNE